MAGQWIWIRHAPGAGPGGRLLGRRSDIGCAGRCGGSIRKLARGLPDDALLLTSHLLRSRWTADRLTDAGWAPAERRAEPRLAEQDFGLWDGQSYDDLSAGEGEAYAAFWTDPVGNRPPAGESFADLARRVEAVIRDNVLEPRPVVVVAHAGSVRAAMAMAEPCTLDAVLARPIAHLVAYPLRHRAKSM